MGRHGYIAGVHAHNRVLRHRVRQSAGVLFSGTCTRIPKSRFTCAYIPVRYVRTYTCARVMRAGTDTFGYRGGCAP